MTAPFDEALRCYCFSRPELVEGVMNLLAADKTAIRKTKEQNNREKGKN